MSGASIDQTLDLWAAELGAVKEQLQPLFARPTCLTPYMGPSVGQR
jgi:hypothetical protein